MQSANDFAFFGMIDSLLNEQDTSWKAERRKSVRRPYRYVQLVAPYDGEELPSQSDFEPVECQDLSCRGFSFCSEAKPTHGFVVVALGTVPFTFVAAQVVRTCPVIRRGKSQVLVGCRFIKRIETDKV